jgi:hypothetical protein
MRPPTRSRSIRSARREALAGKTSAYQRQNGRSDPYDASLADLHSEVEREERPAQMGGGNAELLEHAGESEAVHETERKCQESARVAPPATREGCPIRRTQC